MEKEFIPYAEALALKELGFDEPCFGFYLTNNKINLFKDCKWEERTNSEFIHHFMDRDTSCVAPTFFQAFRWFREKYDLVCIITFDDDVKGKWFGNLYGHYETHGKYDFGYTELFKTYEEAELECLVKLIEIVKEKQL